CDACNLPQAFPSLPWAKRKQSRQCCCDVYILTTMPIIRTRQDDLTTPSRVAHSNSASLFQHSHSRLREAYTRPKAVRSCVLNTTVLSKKPLQYHHCPPCRSRDDWIRLKRL